MRTNFMARLARRHGKKRRDGATRREVLAASLAAGAALLFSGKRVSFADDKPKGKRVVIVGAGFGGLAAAHELLALDYDVTVVEARPRVGGRVLTFRDLVPGKHVEGGAELIGSNHAAWIAYAEKFALEFTDMGEEELAAPIVLGGKRLSVEEEEAIWEAIEGPIFDSLDAESEQVDSDAPWNTPGAAALDARTIRSWIDGVEASAHVKACIDALVASDNAQDTRKSSYLGMLAAVKGGGVDDYWSDTEVWRCKGGNDQLAAKLATSLGEGRIRLGVAVTAIKLSEKGATVILADGKSLEADDVILATPPPTWTSIAFEPALPPALVGAQVGKAVKYLAHVKKRFWLDAQLSQYCLTDGPVSQTWDGTDAQPGEEGALLVGFSGGPAAETTLGWKKEERDERYLNELELIYPTTRPNFVRSRYMDWPKDPLTGCAYSFPAPGQVTTVGPALRAGVGGRLHFAGEHCCYAFVGYMEGGLQSGIAAAARLAQRDGLAAVNVPRHERKPVTADK